MPASAMGNTRPARGQRTIANRRPTLRGSAALDSGFDQQPGGMAGFGAAANVHCVAKRKIARPMSKRSGRARPRMNTTRCHGRRKMIFTPARLVGRIGCRLFLAHHRILTQ